MVCLYLIPYDCVANDSCACACDCIYVHVCVYIGISVLVLLFFRCRCVCVSTVDANVCIACMYVTTVYLLYTQIEQQQHLKNFKESLIGRLIECVVYAVSL